MIPRNRQIFSLEILKRIQHSLYLNREWLRSSLTEPHCNECCLVKMIIPGYMYMYTVVKKRNFPPQNRQNNTGRKKFCLPNQWKKPLAMFRGGKFLFLSTVCISTYADNDPMSLSRTWYLQLSLALKKLVWSWMLQCGPKVHTITLKTKSWSKWVKKLVATGHHASVENIGRNSSSD